HDLAKLLDTFAQEAQIVFRRQQALVRVKGLRVRRIHIHPSEAFDVEHPTHIQHVQRLIGAESYRTGEIAETHAVVEKLKTDALVASADPCEKHRRHS